MMVGLVGVALLLFVRGSPQAAELLSRMGLNIGTGVDTGGAITTSIGLPRQIVGETHGGGVTDNERRRFVARAGQELALEYDIELERGQYLLYVMSMTSMETVWERKISAAGAESVRIRLPAAGVYEVVSDRRRYAGKHRIGWEIE